MNESDIDDWDDDDCAFNDSGEDDPLPDGFEDVDTDELEDIGHEPDDEGHNVEEV